MSDKNIEVLQTHLDHWKRLLAEGEETIEAFQAAIEALKEPCEDAVSRQAVLDAITANCIWENEYNLTSSRIKNVVGKLPPVTPKPRWIPVSEGLPKTCDVYNVTRRIAGVDITDSCYYDGCGTWYDDTQINHERNYLHDITAWMPLPEPWKGESE